MSTDQSSVPAPPEKRCTKCGVVKPLSDFNNAKESRDGKRWQCRACDLAYKASNIEHVRQMRREYKRKNRERIREYNRATREYRREYFRQYNIRKRDHRAKLFAKRRWSDPVAARKREAEYYWKNHAELRRKGRARYAKDSSLSKACSHRRHARKRNLPCRFTSDDVKTAVGYWKNSCAVCGIFCGLVVKLHLDHWIPLSSPECPGTIPTNMVPLCQACNTSKCNRMPEVWLKEYFPTIRWRKAIKRVQEFFEWIHERERSASA